MKGKIPVTQILILESDESQWMMLVRGLVNNLKTTAIIEREPGEKVRVRIIIEKIIPPNYITTANRCLTQTPLGENFAVGISKSKEFLNNLLDKTTWLFMGYIDGDEKTPILIVHHQLINITIYTQKLKDEDGKKFFPCLN